MAKVEVVGDLKVGKTSIIKRLIQNEFVENYYQELENLNLKVLRY